MIARRTAARVAAASASRAAASDASAADVPRCPVCRAPIGGDRKSCSRRCATIAAKRAMRLRRRVAVRTAMMRFCDHCSGIMLVFLDEGGPERRYHSRGECARMERRLRRKMG